MSASEKLKALDPRGRAPVVGMNFDANMKLIDALPQILAVVQCAETVNADLYFDPPLAAALSALEEALGDVT